MAKDDTSSYWAWMTYARDGHVSMVGAMIEGHHTPLCHGKREFVERILRPLAKSHARASGQKVWLREFTGVIDHGEA